ncbi:MAG: T9SS type A sorting domain-containing protein [Candidatus Eisenbacteria bacterium]|nr:T9SS type A sorting domain-containing protein [Candidatus Eisenbacteria bacterium]
MLTEPRLAATDALLGLPSITDYPSGGTQGRGLELGADPADFVRIEADPGKLFVSVRDDSLLDQLRVVLAVPNDCNHNGVFDQCDVASGTSQDQNHNLIPDECETSTAVDDPLVDGASGLAVPLPEVVTLDPPRPNPTRSGSVLRLGLPAAERVRVTVFDVAGRIVHKLVDDRMQAGWYELLWDGSTGGGRRASQGVYFIRVQAETKGMTQRLVVLE